MPNAAGSHRACFEKVDVIFFLPLARGFGIRCDFVRNYIYYTRVSAEGERFFSCFPELRATYTRGLCVGGMDGKKYQVYWTSILHGSLKIIYIV